MLGGKSLLTFSAVTYSLKVGAPSDLCRKITSDAMSWYDSCMAYLKAVEEVDK